ncbi:MAG TPA: hypothetical protein DCG78_00115 [Anaerolineaceae bacterium]|nr:hypothetical protein [Anaerolineaceae bacterium]
MFKKKAFLLLGVIALTLVLFLAGCQFVNAPLLTPTETKISGFHLQGAILYFEKLYKGDAVIHFGEIKDPAEGMIGYGFVHIPEDCEILKRLDGEEEASLEDLAVGQMAEIFVPEILESYPWQATATKVIITSPDPKESLKPLSLVLAPDFEGIITAIHEQTEPFHSLTITLEITSAPKYPELKEETVALDRQALLWEETASGYELISRDALVLGQKISVLLKDQGLDRIVSEIIVLLNEE